MSRQTGFTLIELVITLLLISVLAVTVAPKFIGKSDISPYAIRDQLISQLRLVQLQALNQTGVCHNLIINSHQFGIVKNLTDTCGATPDPSNAIEFDDVTINVAGNSNLDFRFDSSGRVSNVASSVDCNGCVTINIVGSETVQIIIESEGYIHAL